MKLPLYIVDAFSRSAFGGNPAAVCLLITDIGDNLKQEIAAEINLSETAFVVAKDIPHHHRHTHPQSPRQQPHHHDHQEHLHHHHNHHHHHHHHHHENYEEIFKVCSRFELSWFTPATELSISGHATLASAAVIFKEIGNQSEVLEFETRQRGILTVSRTNSDTLELTLPLDPPTLDVTQKDKQFWSVVSKVVQGQTNKVQEVKRSNTGHKCMVIRLKDEIGREGLENLPVPPQDIVDFGADVGGVVVTVKGGSSDEAFDFYSRYFGHWVSIPEDPVTGSSFAVLAPFWSQILNGRKEFRAKQCSRRGGELSIVLEDETVRIRGETWTVLKGEFRV